MKRVSLIILTIILFSCNEKMPSDVEGFKKFIRRQNQSTYYVIVINTKCCITCFPNITFLIDELNDSNIDKNQVYIILTDMREINKVAFLQEKLHIEKNRYNCYFNDELNYNLTNYYKMPLNMFHVLYFNEVEKVVSFREIP